MKYSIDYQIPDSAVWTPVYVQNVQTNQGLVKELLSYSQMIKNAFLDPGNELYFKGYTNYHKIVYIMETLIGEGNVGGSTTMSVVETYLENADGSRLSFKINNLRNAMHTLFPETFQFTDEHTKLPVETFTTEFICNLHKEIGSNIIDDAGEYRKKWCGPAQENWTYLVPENIGTCLESLCKFVRNEMEKELSHQKSEEERVISRIKIVSTFFCNFLQIHPFSNGNGRVARLLLSWLLLDLSIVPVPLSSSREVYLNCLRDARYVSPIIPSNMSRLIMEAVVHTVRSACICMDLHPDQ